MSKYVGEPVRWDLDEYVKRSTEARERSKALEGPSEAERFLSDLIKLPRDEAVKYLEKFPSRFLNDLLWYWPFWARPKQLAPETEWLVWLVLSGRGFGKSRSAAEWVRSRIDSGAARVVGIVGPTHSEIHKFMLGGHQSKEGSLDGKRGNNSGLFDVFPPDQRPTIDINKGIVTFYTGAVGFISTAEEPELRGANFDTIWCDELAKWRYLDEIWYNIEMTCRVPPSPRIMVTTTPKNLPRIRALVADPDTYVTLGTTRENSSNVDKKWLAKQYRTLGGTRTGDQELNGEILDDNEGALWDSSTIDMHRIYDLPELTKIAVGMDPAISKNRRSDATGIVVQGLGKDGHVYVLADRTGCYTPEQWQDIVITLWERWAPVAPTVVVVERNRGGDGMASGVRAGMYRRKVRKGGDHGAATAASEAIMIHEVLALGDKKQRAEPVASLAKRGFVHHVGNRDAFKVLESEQTGWDPNIEPDSPNAIDAHVHGVRYLIPELAGETDVDPATLFSGFAAANARMPAPIWAEPRPKPSPNKQTVSVKSVSKALFGRSV